MAEPRNLQPSDGAFGYDQRLPENIREIFSHLCQDLELIQVKWSFYLELYGSAENTALMSELARRFFQTIEESLRQDLTMSICRLSDPPRSRGMDNLSLQALNQLCGKIDNVAQLLKDFGEACEPVRQYRNKRVGHNDLKTAIKPHDNPLPGVGRKQIDTILQRAGQVLDVIYGHFTNEQLYFGPIPVPLGAEDLVYWLKQVKEYKERHSSK